MALIIAIAALAALAALALRFGADSRPGFETLEHTLARRGMTWDDVSRPAAPAVRIFTARAPGMPYPTLRAIDEARGAGISPLAAEANAARLETRARQLTGEYWSEHAWLTGQVPQRAFELVVAALEKERAVPKDDIAIFVMGETSGASRRLAI